MVRKQRFISSTRLFPLVIMFLIIITGILRLPLTEGREAITALFRISGIIFLSILIWKDSNKWVALFLLSTLIPQLYLAKRMNLFQFENSMFFPDIDTLITSFNVFFGILWYWFLVTIKSDSDFENCLMNAMAIIALANVIYLFVQFTNKNSLIGLLTNQNEISALLAIGFSAFLRRRWIWGIPLILIGIVLSRSCCGAIGIFVGGLVYGSLTFVPGFFSLSILGIYVILLVLYLKFIDLPSIAVRWEVWKNLLNEYKKCWFWGFEFGQLKWITLKVKKFRHIDGSKIWWYTANNEFIHVLCEKGIVFAIIIFGFLGNIIRRAIKVRPILSLTALSIIITTSCFTYIFHNGQTALFSIIWLAILERQFRRASI